MDMTAFTGRGILASSALDLVKWADAVASDRVVPLGRFEYPYGWGVRHYFGDDVIEQSGEIDGVISYLAHYRKAHVTIVYLSNVEVEPDDAIGRAVGALALGQTPPAPLTWPDAAPATNDSETDTG